MIQPGASLVEISGSAGAAFLVAYGWRWLWNLREPPRPVTARVASNQLPARVGPAS